MSSIRTINTTEVEKKCTCCKEWKNTDEFSPVKRGAAGVSGECRDCFNEKQRKKRAKVMAAGGYPVIKGPKHCPTCGTRYENGEESFSKDMYSSDGLQSQCKSCVAVSNAIYKAENPLQIAVRNANHRARTLYNDDNQLDFDEVEAKFKEMGNTCVFCGTDKKVAIDHDIPFAQGGLNCLDNVQPCCGSCNNSKNDKTSDEYREILEN